MKKTKLKKGDIVAFEYKGKLTLGYSAWEYESPDGLHHLVTIKEGLFGCEDLMIAKHKSTYIGKL